MAHIQVSSTKQLIVLYEIEGKPQKWHDGQCKSNSTFRSCTSACILKKWLNNFTDHKMCMIYAYIQNEQQ